MHGFVAVHNYLDALANPTMLTRSAHASMALARQRVTLAQRSRAKAGARSSAFQNFIGVILLTPKNAKIAIAPLFNAPKRCIFCALFEEGAHHERAF
jgi:hypothetical protein